MYVCYHQTSVFVAIALLGGIGYWLFNVRKHDIVLSGRKFTDNELLVGFAAVVGTVLFYVRTHTTPGCSRARARDERERERLGPALTAGCMIRVCLCVTFDQVGGKFLLYSLAFAGLCQSTHWHNDMARCGAVGVRVVIDRDSLICSMLMPRLRGSACAPLSCLCCSDPRSRVDEEHDVRFSSDQLDQ